MKLSRLAAVAAVGVAALGFAAGPASAASTLSGTWIVSELIVCGGSLYAQLSGTITFNSDGTGTTSYVYEYGLPPTSVTGTNQSFTYTNTSTSVTITENSTTIDYNAFSVTRGDHTNMTLLGSDANGCIHQVILNQ